MIEFINNSSFEVFNEYENFVMNNSKGNFMQSLLWASVKSNWNYEAIIVRDEYRNIIASTLVLIKKIPLINSTFLYSPHGMLCDYNNKTAVSQLMNAIEILRKKYNAYEFVCDPAITEYDKLEIEILKKLGFAYKENAPEMSTIQARNNYILNLKGRTKEELFSSFHKKWRYNIRVAIRKGVECRVCGKEALDDFYKLMIETGQRDGFPIRSSDYFKRMLDSLGPHCRLYMCYYNNIPLSGAVAVQYAGKTCYVYGASAERHRNVMPNYLMQWNMICWAVENKCLIYDFQGIPYYKDETHPNYGVYRFKKGFNGEVMTYAGEFSLCYKPFIKCIIKCGRKIYRRITGRNPAELLNFSKG